MRHVCVGDLGQSGSTSVERGHAVFVGEASRIGEQTTPNTTESGVLAENAGRHGSTSLGWPTKPGVCPFLSQLPYLYLEARGELRVMGIPHIYVCVVQAAAKRVFFRSLA